MLRLKTFITLTLLGSSINSYGQHDRHSDAIIIAKKMFSSRLKAIKRDRIYCTLVNTSWKYKNDFIEPEGIKQYFKDNEALYQKLFNEKEIAYYKKQIDDPIDFTPCEIETDSIYIYNKKRDFGINRNNKAVLREDYSMVIPLFTRDHNYALFSVSSPFGGGHILYKREESSWIRIRYFKNVLY